MEGILKFNLPEESDEFNRACNAMAMSIALWDFDQKLRSIIKYESDKYSDDYVTAVEKMRELLHEICTEQNVNIDLL